MINKIKCFILVIVFYIFGCDQISAGSGSLVTYSFATSKQRLEAAVLKVIAENNNIYREPETSQEYKDMYKEVIKERNRKNRDLQVDTNYVDYYNDGKTYLTIKLKDYDYEFTFRYYGDEKEWKSSPRSEFFIVYAFNKYRKGGGYNDNLDPSFIKELTNVFEQQFANKVESELGVRYIRSE
jgi:hypothetical protein